MDHLSVPDPLSTSSPTHQRRSSFSAASSSMKEGGSGSGSKRGSRASRTKAKALQLFTPRNTSSSSKDSSSSFASLSSETISSSSASSSTLEEPVVLSVTSTPSILVDNAEETPSLNAHPSKQPQNRFRLMRKKAKTINLGNNATNNSSSNSFSDSGSDSGSSGSGVVSPGRLRPSSLRTNPISTNVNKKSSSSSSSSNKKASEKANTEREKKKERRTLSAVFTDDVNNDEDKEKPNKNNKKKSNNSKNNRKAKRSSTAAATMLSVSPKTNWRALDLSVSSATAASAAAKADVYRVGWTLDSSSASSSSAASSSASSATASSASENEEENEQEENEEEENEDEPEEEEEEVTTKKKKKQQKPTPRKKLEAEEQRQSEKLKQKEKDEQEEEEEEDKGENLEAYINIVVVELKTRKERIRDMQQQLTDKENAIKKLQQEHAVMKQGLEKEEAEYKELEVLLARKEKQKQKRDKEKDKQRRLLQHQDSSISLTSSLSSIPCHSTIKKIVEGTDKLPRSISEEELMHFWRTFRHQVPLQQRRYHDTVYQDAFVGSEAVDWIIANWTRDKLERRQAVWLGNCVMLTGGFRHVAESCAFMDANTYYIFTDAECKYPAQQLKPFTGLLQIKEIELHDLNKKDYKSINFYCEHQRYRIKEWSKGVCMYFIVWRSNAELRVVVKKKAGPVRDRVLTAVHIPLHVLTVGEVYDDWHNLYISSKRRTSAAFVAHQQNKGAGGGTPMPKIRLCMNYTFLNNTVDDGLALPPVEFDPERWCTQASHESFTRPMPSITDGYGSNHRCCALNNVYFQVGNVNKFIGKARQRVEEEQQLSSCSSSPSSSPSNSSYSLRRRTNVSGKLEMSSPSLPRENNNASTTITTTTLTKDFYLNEEERGGDDDTDDDFTISSAADEVTTESSAKEEAKERNDEKKIAKAEDGEKQKKDGNCLGVTDFSGTQIFYEHLKSGSQNMLQDGNGEQDSSYPSFSSMIAALSAADESAADTVSDNEDDTDKSNDTDDKDKDGTQDDDEESIHFQPSDCSSCEVITSHSNTKEEDIPTRKEIDSVMTIFADGKALRLNLKEITASGGKSGGASSSNNSGTLSGAETRRGSKDEESSGKKSKGTPSASLCATATTEDGEPCVLLYGVFSYALFDLRNEKVEVFVQLTPPYGPWTSVGISETDRNGRLIHAVPYSQCPIQSAAGHYPVRMVVLVRIPLLSFHLPPSLHAKRMIPTTPNRETARWRPVPSGSSSPAPGPSCSISTPR
ncbi:tryptophan--tRNA ligase, variant 2 [Balamuthia mandrillaris]